MKFKLLFILSLIVNMAVFGQEDTITLRPKKSLNMQKNFQYDITFKPKINDAVKISIVPVNEKLEIREPTIQFDGEPVLFQISFGEGEKIPSIRLKRTGNKEKLGRLYLKSGIGNYNNFLFNAHFNSIKNKDYLFTADLKHHSGISSIEKSNASEQFVRFGGKRIYRDKSLGANLYLSNNTAHFYGFEPGTVKIDTIEKDDIRQNFLDIGFNVNFSNDLTKKDQIKYWLDAGLYNMVDHYETQELGINFMAMLEQKFMDNPMRFRFDYRFLNYGKDDKNTRNILNFKASYILKKELWQSEIGFNIASEGDTIDNYFHFYPILHAEAQFIPGYLSGFGGLKGSLDVNSFQSVSMINPYIYREFILKNTNNKFEIYAGLKGSLNEKFGYMFKYAYHNYENLLLFINDSVKTNRFLPLYDSSNTILNHLHVELNYDPLNNLNFFLNTNIWNYDLSAEEYAWHKPGFDLMFTTQYKLQEKIIASLDFFVIGKRYAKNWNGLSNSMELDPIFDVNLGITYVFSKQYAAFFQFNNILGNKYSLWNNYQLRGFHVMGGIKANLFNH